jgi:hypothetical protein
MPTSPTSSIESLLDRPRSVADMLAEEEELSRLPGIGKDLAGPEDVLNRPWRELKRLLARP